MYRIVKLLLDKNATIDVIASDNQMTPRFAACLLGSLATVELLLDDGANSELVDWNERIPLYIASQEGQKGSYS